MRKYLKRAISVLMAAMMVWSSMDVNAFAAVAEAEDSIQNDQIEKESSGAVGMPDEEIEALGSKPYGTLEVTSIGGGRVTPVSDNPTRVVNDIDLRTADYIKVVTAFSADDWAYYVGDTYLYLIDASTGKNIKPCIHRRLDDGSYMTFTDYFRRGSGETWNYGKASIGLGLEGNFKYVKSYKLQSYSIGYASYNFKVDDNYNHMGEYRERVFTGEDRYEPGKLVEYPKPYFTDGNGKHVEEKQFVCGQTVSASVWEGGGTNSQGVKADGNTVICRGFKLAKPGKTNELSGFITNSASFTFDQNFLSKYKDYLSSDGTFTLVPVYEPKYQAVQFFNGYAAVDGKANVKGVYDGFRSDYTQNATKLDTIRVSAKANSDYRISHLILQSPTGAYYNKSNRSDKWTEWRTQSDSQSSDDPTTLEAAINYKGDIWNSSMTNAILNKNLCRVIIYYDNAATGSITMAPSPQSVNEGADGKLTFINGPGAEKNPILGTVVAAGVTFSIENVHLFKPYIFGATSKSGFHAYWKDGTLDTDGDGTDDIVIPGYETFRNTFGDQFKFVPQVPIKNKVYYNFVKDTYVAKEVKPLPIKGYLLLNDELLISGKKVQKGISGITVFASGFTAGQEVTTDARGYYELESNEKFKYYDLYDYNVTFTGENEVGTIGVVYSQNPNKLGNVVVDATADVDISDVKLLIEQNKKDGSGKEYMTVDTSDTKIGSSDGYYALPGGDRNYRLQMSAHRGNEVLAKGVITFTNTNGNKVSIEGTEDASHSGLFTFDFNPKAKGIGNGATARVAFYVGDRALLSRDAGLKVADGIGSIRIINPLTGASSVQPLGATDDSSSVSLIPAAGQTITMDWSGEFDDITDNLSAAYMDGQDRVICVGFGRKILSAGGEKDMLMDLARAAAKAQDEGGEAADKAQSRLDDKIKAIQNEYRQQAEFDDNLPMDLGYSMLMTFGYDEECGKWYFKDMLCTASVDADSDASENLDTGLGLSAGIGRQLKATGRTTIVVEERQDLTDEDRKERRYYITEDNKDSFDILSVAGSGENRRFDSYGRLNLNPEITLTGFSNLAGDLVQADVDGKAQYDLAYGASADSTGTCAQNGSVKLRIMNYSDTIPILNGVYQTGEEDLSSLGIGSEDSYLSQSVDTLKAEDLSYMEGEDTWYGELDDSETAAADGELQALGAIDDGGSESYIEGMLSNRIAPDAGYDMVSLGDGKFAAVFLNVPQNRVKDEENAKAAYYTYFNGSEWSKPELLEDDGTLDLYPHIYSINGNRALIMWSSVNEEYKDTTDRIARQNALDLHGRFVNTDGSLDENVLEITSTAIIDDADAGAEKTDLAADRAIGVSQSGDRLVIAYEKRAYKSSGTEAMVRDMFYPESTQIAYRTYDLANDGFENEPDDGNTYVQKYYEGYLPEVVLQEDLDEAGYYREGGAGTKAVKLDNPGAGQLLDSDMATFTAGGEITGVLAYTVDTDGDLSSAGDRELYLSTYDFTAETFAKPVILTGYSLNTDAEGNERQGNSSPRFVSVADDLYLMWLKDGNIVSMNVGNLLQNEKALIKTGEVQGSSYRYADKTPYTDGMTAAYEAPVTLVSGTISKDADSWQTGAISAFDAETDGRYIYVIWPQAADDKPENLEDGLKDIQMWGVKTEISDGVMSYQTSPVQITSHYGERYDDVAFGVYDGEIYGMASKIPSRMITVSEAREIFADSFDEATFVPYAIWDYTGAYPVTFKTDGNGAARIRNAGFTGALAGENASFSLEIHNFSFNDLSGAEVTATDKDGNNCTLYSYVPAETEDGEGETTAAEKITINGLGGGDTYVVTGSVPLAEDAVNAGVTITLSDAEGNIVDDATITRELAPDITLQDISISDTGVRNLYQVAGRVINEGTALADAGVISLVVQRGSADKTLKQIEYPALMPGESYEFDEENENDAQDDGARCVLIEVSDDDFTVTDDLAADNGASDDPDVDDDASDDQVQSTEFVAEELQLYAVYSGGMGRLRIPVKDAVRDAVYDTGSASSNKFITRSISESALEDIGFVTGVQVDAVKAAEDDDGNLTGVLVSSGKGQITLEAGETVDIQARILTDSPRKGAQATFDQNNELVELSTGTEGLSYHYEYIGDNAEINTDGMLHTLSEGTGRIKVYVYPDNSEYVADNNTGDSTVVIDGEEFQSMDDEDSYGEDSFHKLPTAAIRTFVIDVNILKEGERTDTTGSYAVGGIQYRIINETDAAVCGPEDGANVKTLTIPATVTIDGKKYNVTRIDAYAFNKSLSIEKLSIGRNVTQIGSSAFEGCENLKGVTFGSALKQIGESAFKGCAGISAVTLPAKLERIEAEAFYGCAGLKNLIIPASVAYIGDKAFAGCTGLLKITVKSDKLTGNNLGTDVFLGVPQSADYNIAIKDAAARNELTDTLMNASDQVTDKKGITYSISSKADKTLSVTGLTDPAKAKLKSLSIPAKVTFKGYKYTVTAIADGAFENNVMLTKVTIPKTVTSIGDRAFAGDTALKSAAIPAAVKTLGAEAYSGCAKLNKVTIASPSLTVGEDAFKGVPDVTVFKYSFKGEEAARKLSGQLLRQSTSFVSRTGLTYEILDPDLTGVLLTGSTDKSIEKLNVPDTVTFRGAKLKVISVQDGAFAYNKNLKKATLGKNVTEICPDAFAGCVQLSSVTMKGVKTIFFGAFTGCTGLKSIKLPKTTDAIDGRAFAGCISLDTVTIQSASPTNLKTVGADAFEDISTGATFKISAKKADKETIKTLLIEAGVDLERIK